ncbi:unnamed protein product [Amoebophrya sp. A120]|nr:unnamed protein product [Amoebophrya sp. A120]|eukprot:GSA120T00019454001.1
MMMQNEDDDRGRQVNRKNAKKNTAYKPTSGYFGGLAGVRKDSRDNSELFVDNASHRNGPYSSHGAGGGRDDDSNMLRDRGAAQNHGRGYGKHRRRRRSRSKERNNNWSTFFGNTAGPGSSSSSVAGNNVGGGGGCNAHPLHPPSDLFQEQNDDRNVGQGGGSRWLKKGVYSERIRGRTKSKQKQRSREQAQRSREQHGKRNNAAGSHSNYGQYGAYKNSYNEQDYYNNQYEYEVDENGRRIDPHAAQGERAAALIHQRSGENNNNATSTSLSFPMPKKSGRLVSKDGEFEVDDEMHGGTGTGSNGGENYVKQAGDHLNEGKALYPIKGAVLQPWNVLLNTDGKREEYAERQQQIKASKATAAWHQEDAEDDDWDDWWTWTETIPVRTVRTDGQTMTMIKGVAHPDPDILNDNQPKNNILNTKKHQPPAWQGGKVARVGTTGEAAASANGDAASSSSSASSSSAANVVTTIPENSNPPPDAPEAQADATQATPSEDPEEQSRRLESHVVHGRQVEIDHFKSSTPYKRRRKIRRAIRHQEPFSPGELPEPPPDTPRADKFRTRKQWQQEMVAWRDQTIAYIDRFEFEGDQLESDGTSSEEDGEMRSHTGSTKVQGSDVDEGPAPGSSIHGGSGVETGSLAGEDVVSMMDQNLNNNFQEVVDKKPPHDHGQDHHTTTTEGGAAVPPGADENSTYNRGHVENNDSGRAVQHQPSSSSSQSPQPQLEQITSTAARKNSKSEILPPPSGAGPAAGSFFVGQRQHDAFTSGVKKNRAASSSSVTSTSSFAQQQWLREQQQFQQPPHGGGLLFQHSGGSSRVNSVSSDRPRPGERKNSKVLPPPQRTKSGSLELSRSSSQRMMSRANNSSNMMGHKTRGHDKNLPQNTQFSTSDEGKVSRAQDYIAAADTTRRLDEQSRDHLLAVRANEERKRQMQEQGLIQEREKRVGAMSAIENVGKDIMGWDANFGGEDAAAARQADELLGTVDTGLGCSGGSGINGSASSACLSSGSSGIIPPGQQCSWEEVQEEFHPLYQKPDYKNKIDDLLDGGGNARVRNAIVPSTIPGLETHIPGMEISEEKSTEEAGNNCAVDLYQGQVSSDRIAGMVLAGATSSSTTDSTILGMPSRQQQEHLQNGNDGIESFLSNFDQFAPAAGVPDNMQQQREHLPAMAVNAVVPTPVRSNMRNNAIGSVLNQAMI